MAAKGSILKEQIIEQILSAFPGSFKYDKEIRIPGQENGETLQIKITLTCAKSLVENGADNAIPAAKPTPTKSITISEPSGFPQTSPQVKSSAPTEQEKKNVEDLLSKLGLLK